MHRPHFGLEIATIAFGLLAACTFAASEAIAQDVGNIGAANPRSVGTQPNANERDLAIGDRVVNKEVIRTTAAGTAQVTFIDKTTLNVGRNSTVTIDKFVYDSQAGVGDMAISMSKGVMRFVGGQISHTKGTTVNTPVATIGVRGGTMTVIFLGGGRILVIDHFGVVDVSNAVSRQTILRSGYAVQVNGRNEPIGEAFPIEQAVLEDANLRLSSQTWQSGGARVAPTDALAARYGIGTGRLAADQRTAPGLDTVGIINAGSTLVANRSQQVLVNNQPVTVTTTTTRAGTTTTTITNTATGTVIARVPGKVTVSPGTVGRIVGVPISVVRIPILVSTPPPVLR